jgi:peptidoglycan hydrolase-like protein with peptidoglycan-binding domain
MRPRPSLSSTPPRLRAALAAILSTALAATLVGVLPTAPAYAANPVTPGNFTGYGFDQCEAPSQSAMRAWRRHSPFRAAGIYISGASRACQRQANLNATWVRNQLADGWRLLPITLGPQASCSPRYPRYGKNIDPTIKPDPANTYYAARAQGRLEARRAVARARELGIVKGSTLFYDLEAFDIKKSTNCTWSALYFMHMWTITLHSYGYASGYYSSAASGIRMLDDNRVRTDNKKITLPDQIWIADWNGKANTSSSYIRSDGWQPYSRLKQYRGGHKETHGGVTINIDSNYLKLRTPRLPGTSTPSPSPSPTPTPSPTPAPDQPRYTGFNLSDPMCTPRSINRTAYRPTSEERGSFVVPLQCLLKQVHRYRYEVTGKWNPQTDVALRNFQVNAKLPVRNIVTLNTWVALLTATSTRTTLWPSGATGADVTRLQRALNAAGSPALAITGNYDTATQRAAAAYQRSVGLKGNSVVSYSTWKALQAGRR